MQVKGTAVDLQGSLGADSVPLGGNGVAAVGNVEGAQGEIIRIFRVDAVLARGDGKGAVGDGNAVLAGEAVAGGGNGIIMVALLS